MSDNPFKVLQIRYLASMPDKVRELRLGWERVDREDWSANALDAIRLPVHRLAGSGGSYGFPEISQLSKHVEQLILDSEGKEHVIGFQLDLKRHLDALISHLGSLTK